MIGGLVVAWRRAAVRGLATGAKGVGTSKRKRKNEYKPSGPIDAFCHNWLGMPVAQTSRIVALCLAAGFVMETFMVKVWIGQTNCALGWNYNARPNSSLTRTLTTTIRPLPHTAHAHTPAHCPQSTRRSRRRRRRSGGMRRARRRRNDLWTCSSSSGRNGNERWTPQHLQSRRRSTCRCTPLTHRHRIRCRVLYVLRHASRFGR